MQVLKQDKRELILDAAKDEFLLNSFEKASIRNISRKTGISIGNIYRYFKNKEDLYYHVISPAYEKLYNITNHHPDDEPDPETITIEEVINYFSELMGDILRTHRKELLILMDGSAGTRFEEVKSEMYRSWTEHVEEHLIYHAKKTGKEYDMDISRPVIVSFLEGFLEIIRRFDDEEKIRRLVLEYTSIFFLGFRKFI